MFGKKKDKKRKVMIIEDDALLLQILSKALVEEGYEIASVMDGLEAEGRIKEFKPELVLLDLILPGIDGFTILKNMRAQAETKKIPVIIVSNLDSPADVKSAKILGAEEYFIKANTKLDKIIETVKKLLGSNK